MTFREKLIELRTGAGLSQAQLAGAIGMSLHSYRKYEQAITSRIPFSAVVALAKALGTDCTAFAQCSDVSTAEAEPAPTPSPTPPAPKAKKTTTSGKKKPKK